jgi:hypothetical protein
LSKDESDLIRSALAAAVSGPYFPDWEFATLFGLDREEVAGVLAARPEAVVTTSWESDAGQVQDSAVIGALNNLSGYPHGREDELAADLGVSAAEVRSRAPERPRGS